MGSCASALRKSSDSSSWKHRPSLVHSEIYKHSSSMPTESVKEMTENVADQPIISSSHVYTSRVSPFNSVTSFSNHGSKEETFFDSQAWIESDCDDDFYSVKGDFTPSRGSTPLYRSIPGTPLNRSLSSQVNRALFEGKSPPFYNAESNRSSRGSTPVHRSASAVTNSPPIEPKKKSKKLSDLFRESIRERQPEESPNSDSYIIPEEESQPKEKDLKHAQGCLPRLHSVRLHSTRFLKS